MASTSTFLSSVVILSISFLCFSDSKSAGVGNLKKRRIEISESLCDELSGLVYKLRSTGEILLESTKDKYRARGRTPPDYKNQVSQALGVDISDDTQVREFVCKMAGAENLKDITDLIQLPFPIPEEALTRGYLQTVEQLETIIEEIGFDTLRKALDLKEYMMEYALQHNYVQSTYNIEDLRGPRRYYDFEILEELRKVLTLEDMEDLITDLVKKFGNDYPRLISIVANGCLPPYCETSKIIVQDNRIGCIADAFMFSKNLSDFGTRLGLSEYQARREVDNIETLVSPFPRGYVDFFRSLLNIIELTYEELPGLYKLAGDVDYYDIYPNYGPGPEPEGNED